MSEPTGLPFGVCVLPQPGPNCARTAAYPGVALDTLDHYGLPYRVVPADAIADQLGDLRVLLTVGDRPFDVRTQATMRGWIDAGGVWVSIAGSCGMPGLFRVEVEPPAYASWGGGVGTLGEGYARPTESHALTSHLRIPLHHFNGLPVRAVAGATVVAEALDAHQRATGRAALTEAKHGSGRCILIAPDLTGAIVRIRQGNGITRDGVPSSDGTAPICDDVLKSGDGFTLDWDFDRREVPCVPGFRAFLDPQADRWAELLVRAVLYAASEAGVALPMLWLYPRNLPAVGVLSHDSDGNDPGSAMAMLRAVDAAGIRSTWCIQAPGYTADVHDAIREAGHELAMHFDTMSEGTEWSADEFAQQHSHLVSVLGGPMVSNKNHYLRWEGDVELCEWCAAHGIRLDQSKGASKTGEAGYNFGTCHPYVPVRRDGSPIPVYELCTPTQDLIVFAPPPLAEALTDSVLSAHGVLHLLFHPAHIEKPGVAEAMSAAIGRAKERGIEWWTARRLADWEDARRGVAWSRYGASGAGASVELRAGDALDDATVLWLDPSGSERRFGFAFTRTERTLGAGESARLEAPE